MLVAESRPRNLKWHHAGPLLFGDWGTSRLYVLGLAFFYTGHASVLYLGAMSVIMIAVAWAYTVVCRCFPEGGGVYSSARQLSNVLSVIGATLLLCDYIVTASLSTIEAYHYFGVPHALAVALSLVTIVVLAIVNWFGARTAGRFALVIALCAMAASVVIALLSVPFLVEGLKTVSLGPPGGTPMLDRWQSLVRIMLALSGVEAVSNMTGLMKQPVSATAKRTIWPVLAEVVLFNLIFGVALAGLPALAATITPDHVTFGDAAVPPEVRQYRDTAMRVLAIAAGQNALGETAGFVVGKAASIIFGLLLISASNTAIMAMVSVVYSMARDREMPSIFTRLNYSGVPMWGLVVACVMPCAVLLLVQDVAMLAELYAVGVVGAITINVLSCALNRTLAIGVWERRGLWVVGIAMLTVELTILVTKWHATAFAGGLVAIVLTGRYFIAMRGRAEAAMPVPERGWLAEIKQTPAKIAPGRPRIMLAARGRDNAEFAVDLARKRSAALFAVYVRTLRVLDVRPGQLPRIEDDPQAQETLGTAAVLARQAGVPFFPIYVTATEIADEVLDYTVTFGCDTLIVGQSRRRPFARALSGDVVSRIAQHLPEGVSLVKRSTPMTHEAPPEPVTEEESEPPPS